MSYEICSRFSLILVTQKADRSQTSTGVRYMMFHKEVNTASNFFFFAKERFWNVQVCLTALHLKRLPLNQQIQMHNNRLQLKSLSIWVRNYRFLKNYVTLKGAVSRIVLYYQ